MLTTNRLILRPIENTDYDDICEYGCDEKTRQFMLRWPKTREQVARFIDNCIEKMKSDGLTWYEYVMELKGEKKVYYFFHIIDIY